MALALGVGFVPIRKVSKLPHQTLREEYALEYGTNTVEIHRDAILPQQRVLIIDDLLATAGTASAVARLVEALGGKIVGFSFLIELLALEGRKNLAEYDIQALIAY